MHFRAAHNRSSSNHAQSPTSRMQSHENAGNVADRPLRRRSKVDSSIRGLISPALANLKSSCVCLSRRPQKRPPRFQDDFQRDINIVIPQKDGNENRTRVHVATFDTRADWNFIDEHLVRDCDRAPSCSGDTQRDPPLPLISSIGGREIQVCGRITLRFQVLDKPCLHKKIFAQPRFIKADFLIVRPQAARCDFEALISLKTFQEEGLDRQTARRFLRQGGRRELHPEMAEESDRHMARQRQMESKIAEEIEQGYAEASSDRRGTAVPKAKKRKKRFGRRS